MASTAKKVPAAKTAAKPVAKKAAAPRKAPAKKATARKVATTGFVWSCECGKTSSSSTHPDVSISGRCPECNTPLVLQEH